MTVLLLSLVLWLAAPQQQAPPRGTESISGIVMQGETLRPLPHARLELIRADYGKRLSAYEKPCRLVPDPDDPGKHRYAMTDANGKFTFTEIVPGRYYLAAEHEGYLKTEYGQRGRFPLGMVMEIGLQDTTPPPPPTGRGRGARATVTTEIGVTRPGMPRELLQNLVLHLYPAPTIIGRVHDDAGSRLPAAIVQAYQYRLTPLNGRTLRSIRSIFTDDNGDYRLFGLNPGRYVVSAGYSDYVKQPWTEGLRFTPNLPDPDNGYPIGYFNGVFLPADAVPVSLNAVSAPAIDFALTARKRFSVGVRLTGIAAPLGTQLFVAPYGGDFCTAPDFQVVRTSDRTFEIRGIPEGLYLISAVRGPETYSDLLTLNVSGPNQNFEVPILPPVDIPVSVTFPPELSPSQVRVNLTRVGNQTSQVVTIDANDGGEFLFKRIGPGSYYVTADTPPGYFVNTASAVPCPGDPPGGPVTYAYLDGDRHLHRERPLLVPDTIPNAVRCLSVAVARGGALFGRVLDKVKMPVSGALVVGLPKSAWWKFPDSKTSFTPADRFVSATTDQDGRFELIGIVPAAEYKLFAFEDLEPNLIYDPDFIDRFPNRDIIEILGQTPVTTISIGTFLGNESGPCTQTVPCVLKVIPAEETQGLQ